MSDDEILEPCMEEKEDEFKEEKEAMEVEKSQENQQAESNDIPALQQMKISDEEGSSNSASQMNTAIEEPEAIRIPNWLIEVLEWIKRTEMANSCLSTSSYTFNQLCWPKLHGRKVKAHRVKRLASLRDANFQSVLCLCKDDDDLDYSPQNYTTIPIAKPDPPKYITGFDELSLYFLDGPILEFTKNMFPSFDPIRLSFFRYGINDWNADDIRIGPIHHLLTILAPKIHELILPETFAMNLSDFNRLFPGIIEEIHFIATGYSIRTDWDLLLQWLTKQADGKPKILAIEGCGLEGEVEQKNNFVEQIKEEFLHSKQKAVFIISLGDTYMADQTLENEATGELLSIYQGENWDEDHKDVWLQYLVRHPKGMEYLRTNCEEKFLLNKKFTLVDVKIQKEYLAPPPQQEQKDLAPPQQEQKDELARLQQELLRKWIYGFIHWLILWIILWM